MTINQKPPLGGRESLIERANQVYGLRDSILKPLMPPPAPDAPVPPRAPVAPVQTAPVPVAPPTAPVSAPVMQFAIPEAPVMAPPVTPAPVAPAPVVQAAAPVAQSVTPPAPPVMAPAAEVAPVAPPAPQHRSVNLDLMHLKESGLIVPGSPPTMLSEEFRLVKRQLMLQAFGGQNVAPLDRGRQILVCSAQPNEGKSFCSVNLALSLASESDLEVLLVDADVAKPEVLSILGLPAGPGLMDALADTSIDAESLILSTSVPGLKVLPAGRQTNNDTELLAAPRSRGLIEKLPAANPRRIVIWDSAPALAASPASVLAMHVGQIMLVVKADSTSESELREALAMLEGNARVQLLLNNVTFSGSNRKFGSYYGLGGK